MLTNMFGTIKVPSLLFELTATEKELILTEVKGTLGALVGVFAVGSILIPTILVPGAAKLLTANRHKIDTVVRQRKLPVSSAWMDTWEFVRTHHLAQGNNTPLNTNSTPTPPTARGVSRKGEVSSPTVVASPLRKQGRPPAVVPPNTTTPTASGSNAGGECHQNPGLRFLDLQFGWKSGNQQYGARTGGVRRLLRWVTNRALNICWEEGLTILICLVAQRYLLHSSSSSSSNDSGTSSKGGGGTHRSIFSLSTDMKKDALHTVFHSSMVEMFAFSLSDQPMWLLNILPKCLHLRVLSPPSHDNSGGAEGLGSIGLLFGRGRMAKYISLAAATLPPPIFTFKSLLRMAHCAPMSLSQQQWISTQSKLTPKDIFLIHLFTAELPRLIRVFCGLGKSISTEVHPSNFGLKPAALFSAWSGKPPGSNYDVNHQNRSVPHWLLAGILEGRRGYILFTHCVSSIVSVGVVYGFALLGQGAVVCGGTSLAHDGGGDLNNRLVTASGVTEGLGGTSRVIVSAVDAVERGLIWTFGKVLFCIFDSQRGGPYLFGVILGRAVASSFE